MSNKTIISYEKISTLFKECDEAKNKYVFKHVIDYYFKARDAEESLKKISKKIETGDIIFNILIPKNKEVIAHIFVQVHMFDFDNRPMPYCVGWIDQKTFDKYALTIRTKKGLVAKINSKYLVKMKYFKEFLKYYKSNNYSNVQDI